MNAKKKSHIINKIRGREAMILSKKLYEARMKENNLRNHRMFNQLAAMTNMSGNQFDILGPIYRAA